ncbi:MAG: hypothetical protein DRP65_05795, partial [Planctomycetota bacterium]
MAFGASIDAGSNQIVGLTEASTTGVKLDSAISDPNASEVFTYSWSGGFATIDYNNNTTTAADPNVTFTAKGDYVLTLDVTSNQGAELSDTVTITVLGASLDAGPDQTVQVSTALIGVALNSTISDANDGEVFTYSWSGGFATIDDNNTTTAADPTVTFTAGGVYVLTLNVTGDEGAILSDTVTITVETNWTGATGGAWHTAGNWDTGLVPDANGPARLGEETAEDQFAVTVVNIDAAANANSLTVADDPNYPYTVNVNSGGSLTTTGSLNIAPESVGIVNVLAGSPLTIGNDIIIGDDGIGTLSALASSVITVDDLMLGDHGDGTFNMTGGTLTVSDNIEISHDDNGIGTMTLDTVVLDCDDIYIANKDDDGDGSGVGELTLTNCDTTIDDGDLRVGSYGTGTVTVTGGDIYIKDDLEIVHDSSRGTGTVTFTNTGAEVGDDIQVGSRGIGTLTLNDTGLSCDKLRVGNKDNGDSTLIMNGSSSIEARNNVCFGGDDGSNSGGGDYTGKGELFMYDEAVLEAGDQMRFAQTRDSVGYLYTGPDTELATVGGEDLKFGANGRFSGTVEGVLVVGGHLTIGEDGVSDCNFITASVAIDGDFYMGKEDDGDAAVEMIGGDVNCDHVYIAKDAGSEGSLIMNGTEMSCRNFVVGSSGTAEVTLSGDALVTQGGNDVIVGDNNTAHGILRLRDVSELSIGDDFIIADDGGTALIDMDGGTLTVPDDTYLASMSIGDEPGNGTLVVRNGTFETRHITIGGGGSTAAIIVRDGGTLTVEEDTKMPNTATTSGGGATITIGEESDVPGMVAGDALIVLGTTSSADIDFAKCDPDTDYVDFLCGGVLRVDNDELDETDIIFYIDREIFRSTYSASTLYGDTPGDGEGYVVVYKVSSDPNYFDIYAEIGEIKPDDTEPPTPNPATFVSAPAAVSDTAITMMATTGTD